MIKNLHGFQETVSFKSNTTLQLYDNSDYEAYQKHWHAPLEIIMPITGQYLVTYYDTKMTLNEGDIFFINPGVIHSMDACKGSRLIFQADFAVLSGIKALESALSLTSPTLLITKDNAPNTHPIIQELMLKIKEEFVQDSPLSEASIYSMLIEMFVLIGRDLSPSSTPFDSSNKKHREYSERLLDICDYISAHCCENITLDDIAGQSGFSKYHFSRLFKQFKNVTFYRFLNIKRIEHSEKLLINQELTVTEIALSSGFGSLSGFIRMFKLIKGCTPTEFKQMYTS